MKATTARHHYYQRLLLVVFICIIPILACQQSAADHSTPWSSTGGQNQIAPAAGVTPSSVVYLPVQQHEKIFPPSSPTPDPPHLLPTLRADPEEYVVQAGDTLGQIARRYGISLDAVIDANQLKNPNILEIGQRLIIPAPQPGQSGPAFKIIPDSELVYGPQSVGFDVSGFIQAQAGYLARYHQQVEDLGDSTLSGAEIVTRIAQEYSVNPRLLLALLDYQSGWVSQANPDQATLEYPIGIEETKRQGLYRQLAWAANALNRGYYLWRVNGISSWFLPDGAVVPIAATINAGTAAVQQFFAQIKDRPDWLTAGGPDGLFAKYQAFFGSPFDRAIEPLLPNSMRQPAMQLPFEEGVTWAFTGGPHGGWGDGAAWAALDFAPAGEALGCVPSDAWVVAVVDGLIIRAQDGEVIQDLDGDGYEQTGWTVLYMHVDQRGRVQPGTYLQAGERIGHPSCEGGFSTGTHLHLARRYNGEWIPADQTLPFVLDNWVSRGLGIEYDGFLEKDGKTIEAWNGISAENSIQR